MYCFWDIEECILYTSPEKNVVEVKELYDYDIS